MHEMKDFQLGPNIQPTLCVKELGGSEEALFLRTETSPSPWDALDSLVRVKSKGVDGAALSFQEARGVSQSLLGYSVQPSIQATLQLTYPN